MNHASGPFVRLARITRALTLTLGAFVGLSQAQWTQTAGPVGGVVQGLVENQGLLFAATNGMGSAHINELAVMGHFLIASTTNAIYRSWDKGVTWDKLANWPFTFGPLHLAGAWLPAGGVALGRRGDEKGDVLLP